LNGPLTHGPDEMAQKLRDIRAGRGGRTAGAGRLKYEFVDAVRGSLFLIESVGDSK